MDLLFLVFAVINSKSVFGLVLLLNIAVLARAQAHATPDLGAFSLRHVFHQSTNSDHDHLLHSPIPQQATASFKVSRQFMRIPRVADVGTQEWQTSHISGPNVTDRDTIINFALMASNAYAVSPESGAWEDLNSRFGLNTSLDFGWESNGIRGHVFADELNATVVIAIKGTSRAMYDRQETETADKENDNLFCSCCCGQQGQWTWRQVCGCATGTYECSSTCLAENLRKDHRYYQASRYLYGNITALYPGAEVWLTGHSLGGIISALLGLTYGHPTITFEAPGDALAASRLGIPSHKGIDAPSHIYHFGHTADPLYMGTCGSASSTCTYWGYAFQSQCHTGMMCTYDTVGDLGWRVGVWTHGIDKVIRDVLRKYDHLPTCVLDDECVDCYEWKFHEGDSPATSSFSSRTSRTRSRTATCETPGWWGCRDSTTALPTASSSSTLTTTSCRTPGWFGCKDEAYTNDMRMTGSRLISQTAHGVFSSPTITSFVDPSQTPLVNAAEGEL
ncbi:hypothetical protein BP5796_08242 [Coleophoma crateriformis]|uniref:triacylglycerol lipase n=1 Tax=Coleophoma crateriformis TaxID=565419 RepID=A0A3D8RE61_9HELO|nr:hypothetical protein BP5796_08242 [Coleophoma crateriformis]